MGRGASPGVTATSVTVGQVDDLSSPIPGLFKGAEDGTKAYFAYINSKGGINGRKLILDAQDSTFQGGAVATATGHQIATEFALVGGFSLLDSAEKPLIDLAHVPDVGFSLSPGLSTDPYLYSPLPNPESYYPLNLFKYLKKTYPQAVKKVGVIWENATASTTAAENAVEAAMKASGLQIVYDHGVGPFDTNFLPDIIAMKNKGVKMFFSTELPDNYAATLAKQFQQQNFKAINIEGAAYSSKFLSLAGSSANNIYIEQGYALYLGQDANTIPAVGLFNKWMKKVDSDPNFEIESVYGWASAELFAQALENAGSPHTRGPDPGAQQGDVLRRRWPGPSERPRRGHSLGLLPHGAGAERQDQAGGAHAQHRVLLRFQQLPQGARIHRDDSARVVGKQMDHRRNAPSSGRSWQELVVR